MTNLVEIAACDEFFQWVISQVAEAGKELADLHKQIALLHRDIDVRRALQSWIFADFKRMANLRRLRILQKKKSRVLGSKVRHFSKKEPSMRLETPSFSRKKAAALHSPVVQPKKL